MNIETKEECRLSSLKGGDVFCFDVDGEYYMVCNTSPRPEGADEKTQVAKLFNGLTCWNTDESIVVHFPNATLYPEGRNK